MSESPIELWNYVTPLDVLVRKAARRYRSKHKVQPNTVWFLASECPELEVISGMRVRSRLGVTPQHFEIGIEKE